MRISTSSDSAKIFTLLKKEWQTDIRNRSAFYGVFLYSLLTVFLIFYSFKQVEAITWVSLFWIITLFAALNAMAKSFLQESTLRWNYYYTLFSPTQLLLAKFIYNFGLLTTITLFNFILFVVFLGFPVQNISMFLCSVLLGVFSFVFMFSIMSSISAKASKNASLSAILSMPIIIPLLSVLINFSVKTITANSSVIFYSDIVLLSSIDVLMFALGILLFRFIWRD